MDWREEGLLLTVRRHGESAAIIETFTALRGRFAGVVRGGASRRLAPALQPGAQLSLEWHARLDEHIGTFRAEPLRGRAGALFDDADALAALVSATALLAWALPEREAHPELYLRTLALLDALAAPCWQAGYARWELAFLAELGFGLDLSACALGGARDDLGFVSPKSGRAVSRGAAGEWAPKLLALPAFLLTGGPASASEIAAALALTGHFLETRLAPGLERPAIPEARRRLAERLARGSGRVEDEGR